MSKSTGTLSSVVGSGCDAEALATADPMMLESAASVDTSQLDFEVWRAFLRSNCGDQPEVADPNAFDDLRRAIRRLSHAMRTSCLRVSAASSGMASPIRISDLAK